ncbi:MAG: thymidylate synthase [Patescibacteria group bacterium]
MNNQLETWQNTGIMPYHQTDYIPFHPDYEYLRWVNPILGNRFKEERTGKGNFEFFGTPQIEIDLSLGFGLLTTKKVHFKSIKVETLWYLRGDTNIKFLQDNGVTIWNEWVKEDENWKKEDGEIGPLYGSQWTRWNQPNGEKINQIERLVAEIKRARNSKGMFVSSWNPAEIGFDCVKLRPCHGIFQCSVSAQGRLDLKMYQRSADWFLGVPFNIASYSLLLHMLAQVTGYIPGRVINTYGSAHIYSDHVEQMTLQASRTPMPLSTIELNPDIKNIFDFKIEDIVLKDYVSHPKITGDVAV